MFSYRCEIDKGYGAPSTAALRATIFRLSVKNQRAKVGTRPPPINARVNALVLMDFDKYCIFLLFLLRVLLNESKKVGL